MGPGPGEAVLGISNVDLNAAGTLHFSFGLDTPAADPNPNMRLVSDLGCSQHDGPVALCRFSIALRDANNVTLDAAMAVPGEQQPKAKVCKGNKQIILTLRRAPRLA